MDSYKSSILKSLFVSYKLTFDSSHYLNTGISTTLNDPEMLSEIPSTLLKSNFQSHQTQLVFCT